MGISSISSSSSRPGVNPRGFSPDSHSAGQYHAAGSRATPPHLGHPYSAYPYPEAAKLPPSLSGTRQLELYSVFVIPRTTIHLLPPPNFCPPPLPYLCSPNAWLLQAPTVGQRIYRNSTNKSSSTSTEPRDLTRPPLTLERCPKERTTQPQCRVSCWCLRHCNRENRH